MRGVGHEAAHLLHRLLDRARGLADQDVAPDRHQQQGEQRGSTERPDEGCIFVFQLQPIRDDGGHVHRAALSGESLRVQPHNVIVRRLEVPVRQSGARGFPCRGLNPVRGLRRLDRSPHGVEEVEGAIGDVQLVHRVRDHAPRRRLLRLPNPGRSNQGGRRRADRGVELQRHAVAHREK